MQPDIAIDHFTLGARTLEEGALYLKDKLGIEMPPGSKHDTMSTHNRVLKVGDGLFFELLAIDPEAPTQSHPRWFGLDDEGHRARLKQKPRPLTWIARTSDLRAVAAQSPVDLGAVVHFVRGTRSWDLTVRPDGTLPAGGLVPSLIQWSEGPHPSDNMQALGPQLERIRLLHENPGWLAGCLKAMGASHLADVSAAGAEGNRIAFTFRLPDGKSVTLD
jgi:hypothetical protein